MAIEAARRVSGIESDSGIEQLALPQGASSELVISNQNSGVAHRYRKVR